jgi:hypothetical protein
MIARRPGRPSVDPAAASVHVGVTLTAAQYGELCQKARRDDISVPEVIRRELALNKNLKTPGR